MTTPLVVEQTQVAQYIIEQDNEYSLDTDKSVFITNTTIANVAYSSKKTDNQIGGNIKITFEIPQNHALDSNVIVNFPRLRFALTSANTGAGLPVTPPATFENWLTLFDNFKNISFKPFNILNCLNSGIQVSFNGTKITETSDLDIILNELIKYFDKNESEIFNSYNVGQPDTHQIFYNPTDKKYVLGMNGKPTIWNNKDNDSPFADDSFNDVTTSSRRPLFIFPNSTTASENLGFVVENIQMPIPLSVFSSVVGKHGLYGIKTVELSFTLNNNGYNCLSIRPGTSATTINFEDNPGALLITQEGSEKISVQYKTYAAPATVLQEISENKNVVPNYFRPFNEFKCVQSHTVELPSASIPTNNTFGMTPGSVKDFRSNQIVLNSIPEKIYMVIRKIRRDKASTSQAEISMTPSVSCRVSNLNVTFGGASTFIPTSEEISKLSARNGCTIDYLKTLYTHGQVICLNTSNDFSTGIHSAINNKGHFILEINCNLQSLTCPEAIAIPIPSVQEFYQISIFTQNTKILSFDNGEFSTKEFFMGAQDVEFAMNNVAKITKYKRSNRNVVRGGSLPAIFAKIGRTAIKNAPEAIKLANKIYRDFQGAGVSSNNRTNTTGGTKKRIKSLGGGNLERVENI